MSNTDGFPYEYGSDLHCLWTWGKRIEAWIEDDRPPNSYVWMIFRPDGLATDAMMRFSVAFPHVVRQIDGALDFTDKCYERLPEGDAAARNLAHAMWVLRDRIRTGVAIIDQARKPTRADRSEAEGGEPTEWQDVKDRLERLRSQGERYTSQGDLAKQLRCSKTTINKAINASAELKKWMDQARKGKATPRATALSEVVADNVRQVTEPDPSSVLIDDDVDNVMARLIDETQAKGKADEVARLNALNRKGRRALAEAYYGQKLDDEPDPLDDDPPDRRPRQVKHHKQV